MAIQGLVHAVVLLKLGHLSLRKVHGFCFFLDGVLGRQLRHVFDVDEANFAHLISEENASDIIEACSFHVHHLLVRAELVDDSGQGVSCNDLAEAIEVHKLLRLIGQREQVLFFEQLEVLRCFPLV